MITYSSTVVNMCSLFLFATLFPQNLDRANLASRPTDKAKQRKNHNHKRCCKHKHVEIKRFIVHFTYFLYVVR